MGRKGISPWLDFHQTPDRKMIINQYNFPTGSGPAAPVAGYSRWLSDTGSDPAVWPDLNSSGDDAVQATSGKRPQIISGEINGRQVRRFDGVDDVMSMSSSLNYPATCFVVAKPYSPGQYYPFLIGGFGRICAALGTSAWGTYSAGDLSAGETLPSQFHILVLTQSASDGIALYRNGALKATFATTGGNIGGGTFLAAEDSSRFLQCDMAEVLIYPTVLGGADRQSVEDYLGTKYGITITH